MSAHLKYLSYVCRHKWFVLQAGLRTGAPVWRLIIHDWSKFLPSEWFPYVRYFYGATGDCWRTEEAFGRAWLHHQHANPHHWQHWVLREDSGAVKLIEMPTPLVREMVADWMGAGRAITGEWETGDWYRRNYDLIQLAPITRALVNECLGVWQDGASHDG